MSRPGEIAGWPKLKVVYRTDPDRIADLLPPGLEPGANPYVHVNVYCVPVLGEPELGISTKIEADYDGIEGLYSMGMGIDQESAVLISQETNGQPKFLCDLDYFRFGDRVEARASHQGYMFMEFEGEVRDATESTDEQVVENEWWIKYSRAIGGVEKEYDFPPHIVRVKTESKVLFTEAVDGDLILRDSPWDPYTELLPMREQLSAAMVTAQPFAREITKEGALDPIAFWPYADTIAGSRWPGDRGGPRR